MSNRSVFLFIVLLLIYGFASNILLKNQERRFDDLNKKIDASSIALSNQMIELTSAITAKQEPIFIDGVLYGALAHKYALENNVVVNADSIVKIANTLKEASKKPPEVKKEAPKAVKKTKRFWLF